MMEVRWDLAKSEKLKRERGVSFDDILKGRFIGIQEHPKRSHQKLMLFELGGYVWVVPYVQKDEEIFLKTLFPSRHYTKLWKRHHLD